MEARSLVPHRVQVLMDGLASEHLLPCNLELHIRITGPCRGESVKSRGGITVNNMTEKATAIISDQIEV